MDSHANTPSPGPHHHHHRHSSSSHQSRHTPNSSHSGSFGGHPPNATGPRHHRKSASASSIPGITGTNKPPSPANNAPVNSNLNPNAGGFQPGALGALGEVEHEVLVTPLATNFPGGPGFGGGYGEFGPFGGQAQVGPRFGGGGGGGDQGQQVGPGGQTQQLHQQQQYMAEQMQIQMQLDSLRAQQDALIARMGGQSDPQQQQQQGGQFVQQQQQQAQQQFMQRQHGHGHGGGGGGGGHRRHQSQGGMSSMGSGSFGSMSFGGGPMGSFSMPQAQPFQPGGAVGGGGGPQGREVPKGHGRRHSVNVVNKSGPTLPNQQVAQQLGQMGQPQQQQQQLAGGGQGMGGMAPGMGFGGAMQNLGVGVGVGGFGFVPPGAGPGQHISPFGAPDLDFGGGGGGFHGPGGGMGGGHSRRESRSGGQVNWGGNQVVDLAQAQHQLQQLAVYRASAGHGRVPSFGLSQMGGGGGGGGYGGGGGGGYGGGNAQMRKSLFAPYLPQASIPPLVASGALVLGWLRVNKRNRSDAYVATEVLDSDIYICGSKDRNRALEGDFVAVELLDVDDVWGTKKEKEEKKRKKEENAAFDPRATQNARKQDKKKDDVEVEGQGLLLFEDEEVNDEQKPKYAGHVVAVVERLPGQMFSGTLAVLRPSSAATKEKQEAERREREGVDLRAEEGKKVDRPKILWFKPTDKRVPLIAIPTEQAPADFVENPDAYSNKLFVACIKRWPITSLHPFGTLVEQLGTIGDIEAETQALLRDSNCSAEDFTESVLKCLPPLPWTIPEREYETRRDFREENVFTIDPLTAKDLDDALHVKELDDGTYEVGVHIADVSYFVKPNTALDREAKKRGTTVYLVNRAVPMLAPSLSEQLCSLNPGVERLSFSAVFKLNKEGQVVGTWFGKGIIKSKGKLSYDEAQKVLEGKELEVGVKTFRETVVVKRESKPDESVLAAGEGVADAAGGLRPDSAGQGLKSPSPLPPETVDKEFKVEEGDRKTIEKDIKILNDLAKQMRARRFEGGALRIDTIKLKFQLDGEGMPDDCGTEERTAAKELIEEFMLLANISVATKIASGLPDQALLRRHEGPIDRRLDGFHNRAKRLGFDMNIISSKDLQASFKNVEDARSRGVLELLAAKSMLRAKYFCSGSLDVAKYHHYALNVPLYTHFTSPIRRYADLLIHRQLEAIVTSGPEGPKFTMDTDAVNKIAASCNTKRDAAKLAQEQSAHLFLCVLISDLTQKYGPVVRPAHVVGVLDEAFDVVVPDFGIEKRVHVDQMPIDNHVHDEHANTLEIYWKKGVDVVKWLAEHSNDAHLHAIRRTAEHHAKLMEASSRHANAESALFDDDDDDDVIRPPADLNGATNSKQKLKSASKDKPVFEGVKRTAAGHYVQKVEELQTVPVIVTADMTKSPPVVRVVAVNPFA